MAQATYPSKVQQLLRAVERAGRWHQVAVTAIPPTQPGEHSTLWVIAAERPGNVFLAESLRLYVATHPGYTIAGTDVRVRAGQRFQGGYLDRFGSHRELRTARDLRVAL